jgi:hypothetical protein
MTQYHIGDKVSRNEKTGPIFVTTTSADTCPDACPFKKAGCYADGGPLAIHWRAVSEGKRGDAFDSFLAKLEDKIPAGALWRMNQAGDLPGQGDSLDVQSLAKLVRANGNRRGFTYTHKPLATPEEQDAVRRANDAGFTVNLSANSAAHADKLAALGIGPVVAVLPADQTTNSRTPEGRKIVVCPATVRDDVSCATCGLCAIASRDAIVGFPAHGASKRKADAIANA